MHHEVRTPLRYASIISMGGFIFGFDAAVISGVTSFIVPEFGLTDAQLGLVVGAPTLSAIFSGLVFGPLSDWLGRKRLLIFVAFLFSLSALYSALAPTYMNLVIARGIGGFAFASLMLAPMYIAEVSPARLRGLLVSVNQLNIMLGFSVVYFSNYFLLRVSSSEAAWVQALGIDSHAWRWMLGLEAVPAIAYFLLLMTVPESPRWLVVKDRVAEAKHVLAKFVAPERIESEIQMVQDSVAEWKGKSRSRLWELIKPSMRLPILVGLIVGVAQQITGINAVYFYAPMIFEQSGVGRDAAFAQAIWIGIINIIFTLIAMALIDRVGRRPILIIGLAGVACSMFLVAYGFGVATYNLTEEKVAGLSVEINKVQLADMMGVTYDSDVKYKRALIQHLGEQEMKASEGALIQAAIHVNARIVLAGILGFVASFAIALGPIMWVLFSEIFPNHIRGLAIACVGSLNSLVSFLVQYTFPLELSHLGTATTFLIYGIFGVVALILVAWMLPETKGKTLEQMEEAFAGVKVSS
jgi:sugar porter (SP) family MFS transporter